MHHTIVRYKDGGNGWTEFECGRCIVDIDMFDFEQAEICEAAQNAAPFQCPNCRATAIPLDKTISE